MARKFVVSLDLNKNELLNARIQNLSTAPSSPVSGQIYFDTVTNIMYFYNGTAWVSTSGSAEVIQDTVDAMLIAGTGLDKTYNDGAGTLTLDIDSTVTTNDGVQTLTNKTLTSPSVSGLYISDSSIVFEGTADNFETTLQVVNPSADRTLTLPDATDTLVGRNTTDTLTNKTIDLTSNTLQGTLAEFNTALEDANFVSLDGAETLTNKTLTSPTVSGLYLSDSSIVFEGATSNNFETTLSVEDPTADRTLALPNKTGTLATTDDITNAVDAITTTVIEEGTNLYYTDERVDDRVNALLIAGTGITKTYDDTPGNSLTIAVDTSTIATRDYVDAATAGLNVHDSVKYATTAGQILDPAAITGSSEIDNITLSALSNGDRVLIKNATDAAKNGVYTWSPAAGLTRAADYNSVPEVDAGDFIFVENGTVNGKTGWVQTNTITTLGTDPIAFTQFSGTGTYLAGNGLTLDGSTFNVGAGLGIVSNSDTVAIDTTVVARKYATTIGDNSATSFTVTHSLGTKDVIVQVFEEASPYAQVEADVEHSTTSAVVIKFATAPTLNQYRVSVVG